LGLQPLYDPLKRLWDYIVIQPSYVIFKRGNVILAKNGETGEIEFSGTDAATVIQSAIDALGTQGGKIFVKAGTYEIDKSINITKDKVVLQGEGHNTIIKLKDAVNTYMALIHVKANHVLIANLQVDGNKANQTVGNQTGIYFEGTSDSHLTGNHVRGVYVHDTRYVGANKIMGAGIQFDYSDRSSAIGNYCERCGHNGIEFWLDSEYALIANNICKDCHEGVEIKGTGSLNGAIVGNLVEGSEVVSIAVDAGPENIAVVGNSIRNQKSETFYTILLKGKNLVCVGNVIRSSSDGGIWAHGGGYKGGFVIANNAIYDVAKHGIFVEYNYDGGAIVGNFIESPDRENTGNYDGIYVLGYSATYHAEDIILLGNLITNEAGKTVRDGIRFDTYVEDCRVVGNKVKGYVYGVNVSTADCSRIVISNNDLRGNIGGVSNFGTDTIIKQNEGYPTEASNTTSITGDGVTTSFTVDVMHGLVSDKLSAKIACKKPATYKWYLVDTDADGTYETLRIEITFDTAPASGETVEIYWEASVV